MNFRRTNTVLPIIPMFQHQFMSFPYAAAMIEQTVFTKHNLQPKTRLPEDTTKRTCDRSPAAVPAIWMAVSHQLGSDRGRWKIDDDFGHHGAAPPLAGCLFRRLDKLGVPVTPRMGYDRRNGACGYSLALLSLVCMVWPRQSKVWPEHATQVPCRSSRHAPSATE